MEFQNYIEMNRLVEKKQMQNFVMLSGRFGGISHIENSYWIYGKLKSAIFCQEL